MVLGAINNFELLKFHILRLEALLPPAPPFYFLFWFILLPFYGCYQPYFNCEAFL